MKVVRQIRTSRLVWRECPDFKEGKGKINAARFHILPIDDLEEIEATTAEWEAELALREQERPRTDRELLAANVDITIPNPQKESYKLSQLYGLTHEQLDTYIDNLSSGADYKEAFRRALHAILWLVKQTKLDE